MNKNKIKQYINKKNGFTLIELIVVVTIIAVLSVVAIVSYGGTSKRSRDSRRMADLEKVRIALEMARQESGTYPPTVTNSLPQALVSSGYIQILPSDPISTYRYEYNRPTNYTYFLYAQMEDVGSTTNFSAFNGCAVSNGKCNYRLTNP